MRRFGKAEYAQNKPIRILRNHKGRHVPLCSRLLLKMELKKNKKIDQLTTADRINQSENC